MALLVLLLVWGALIATWLRSRAQDGGFTDTVGTFNRHLRILENTAPSRFQAANQRQPRAAAGIGPYRPAPSAGLGPMTDPRRVRPASQSARARAQGQKRRRDVFFALVAGILGSLILGAIPGIHVLWFFTLLFAALMVAYVALLVRMKNMAAERKAKLRYLNDPRHVGLAAGYQPSPAARVSRTGYEQGYEGSVAYQGGYDDGYDEYGYGELAVRRAAN